jgi:hypothetical protein
LASDNGIATRTWQNAIEAFIATKQGATEDFGDQSDW